MKRTLGLWDIGGSLAIALVVVMSSDVGAFNYLLCDSGGCSATYADNAGNVKYGNVAVVAKSGGDFADPVSAMNAVASWCPAKSATNRCLLKIMPGTWDLGPDSLVMQQYVDIEGAGQQITMIKGSKSNDLHKGVVMGASDAELRDLSVENYGDAGGTWAFAIVSEYASPKITRVYAKASGTGYNVAIRILSATSDMSFVTAEALGPTEGRGIETGLAAGTDPQPPEMILRHVRVFAKSYGVVNRTAVTMVDSEISASANPSYGISVFDLLKLYNCRVKGTSYSVIVQGQPLNANAYIANTQLDGIARLHPDNPTGFIRCVNAYNASFVALNSGCN